MDKVSRQAWEVARQRAVSQKPNAPISHMERRNGSDGDVEVAVPKGSACLWSRENGSWSAGLGPAEQKFALLGAHINM